MTTTTRMFSASIRAGKGKTIEGFIPFNSRSELISERGRTFVEVIKPGAFTFTSRVRALKNHDDSQCFGYTGGGGLRLDQRADGLYVTLDPPNTPAGQKLHRDAKAGTLKGVSFSFDVNAGRDEWDMDQTPMLHTMHKIKVDEISFLDVPPAYSATEVTARAKSNGGENVEDGEIETALAYIDIQKQEAGEFTPATWALPVDTSDWTDGDWAADIEMLSTQK